jgi:putative thiamine transport system ATP-binding protein
MSEGLALRGVSVMLGDRALIDRFDLTVNRGECVTLMGPSGCGKSTLLAYVAGSLDAAFRGDGRVLLDGDDVTARPPESRRIGILFQDDLLFPHLSVGGNLAFGLAGEVHTRDERRRLVDEALREADLAGFADRDPATLSGGQRARVALMRTLLARPRGLLLDEPFNKLDTRLRDDMRAFVFEHARKLALPVLLVTHDEADARAAGGRVLEFGVDAGLPGR